jgi:hypothetical protein
LLKCDKYLKVSTGYNKDYDSIPATDTTPKFYQNKFSLDCSYIALRASMPKNNIKKFGIEYMLAKKNPLYIPANF